MSGLVYIAIASSNTQAEPEDSWSWSPRGDRIAYHSEENGNFDIWVAPARGGATTNLTQDHSGLDKHPSWSPDGKQIAFFSEREGGGYFTVSPGGGPARRVSPKDASKGVAELGRPVWSPDGSELAWLVHRGSELSIEIHSLADGLLHVLPPPADSSWRFGLHWSPDGSHIVVPPGASGLGRPRETGLTTASDHETVVDGDGSRYFTNSTSLCASL